ncbi:unnamed protein product [Effrenium voratum]|nr:unnamed protein product [Effrenium voratum]
MLAALVRATAEEVAWEGSPGISWPQLLSRLQKAGLQVDSQARTLLWTELAAGKSGVFVRGKGKAEPQVEDLPEVDSDNPEKPKSKRCSGSKILLDMPDEMRSHYLQLDAHPDLAENEISKGALQLVAKSRAKGCCGATLSAKLGVSSRDLFYPLEGLRTAGLVIGVLLLTRPKGSADGSSGQNPAGGMQGNIFFFSRFFDPDRVEQTQIQMLLKSSSITMQNHVLSVLKLNPSNVAFESDLRAILGQTVEESSGGAAIPRRTIGKIYHRIRADLVSKGDVECVRAWDPKTSNLRDALCIPGKAAGTQKVEPVLAITEGKEDERPAVQRQRGVADHLPSSLPVPPASKATLRVAGRSFAQQAEDLIRCCSKIGNGITSPEIADKLGIRRKHGERVLSDLLKRQRVTRIFESDGKTHLNRYFDAVTHQSLKRTLPIEDGRPPKARKTADKPAEKRVDVTFTRRKQRIEVLLKERGVLTPCDIIKLALDDEALGKMDRKTPGKIFQEIAAADSKVGLTLSEADKVQFAFWKPSHSEESAKQVVDANIKAQHDARFQKLRHAPQLALTDGVADVPAAAAPPAASPRSISRRTLAKDITAKDGNLRRLGGLHMLTTPQKTIDQRILQHYGFQTAVVARLQLLHGSLLRKSDFDFDAWWTPSKIVDDMDLHVFLQVVGCGAYCQQLEDILVSGKNPVVREMPEELRKILLGRISASGSLRALHTIRRHMAQLMKMGLATSDEDPGASSVAPIRYQLARRLQVPTFASSVQEAPSFAGSFDLAEPGAVDAYWSCLQEQVNAWRGASGTQAREDGSDSSEAEKRKSRAPVTLPVNAMLPELFKTRNWIHWESAWLGPHQRAAMNDFYNEAHAGQSGEAARGPGRVFTPKSPEIMALSRRILVAPDRIIKYCRHLLAVCPHPSGASVEFSSLLAVRFKCHICGYLCYQSTTIADHYSKTHSEPLPDDDSKFCEADFYAQRLEQARPTRTDGKQRWRRRRLDRVPIQPWPEAGNADGDEEDWGAEPADDSTWLQLLAFAETMVCAEHHAKGEVLPKRPVGSEARTDASTWPLLTRLSGRSAAYCRNRLRGLLDSDVKNRRAVAAIRTAELQAEGTLTLLGIKGSMGRAIAKCLLFTPHEVPSFWWKPGFLKPDVKNMLNCVLRQWQCNGFVSKYKETMFGKKMPRRARPSWLLTWFSRSRLFGKGNDAPRWNDVLCMLTTSKQPPSHMLPESSDGAQLLILSDAVAANAATLCAVWGDDDFYKQAVSRPPSWHSQVQDNSDEDEEEAETSQASRPSGIQSHLQATSDEPTLQSMRVLCGPLKANPGLAAFLSWLMLREEESAKIVGEGVEPINPQMAFCARADEKEAKENSNGEEGEESEDEAVQGVAAGNAATAAEPERPSGSGGSGPDPLQKVPFTSLQAAFHAYARGLMGHLPKTSSQELLDSAAFLLKTVADAKASRDSGGSELLPGLALAELQEVHRQKFASTSPSSFSGAMACLEDLRLLTPIPCGDDFRPILACIAAPYCVRHVEEPRAPSKLALDLVARMKVGRHWLHPYGKGGSNPKAAACVIHVAFGSLEESGMLLERWLLPANLVAPCAWVSAKGQLNVLVLRCLLSRLLQLLMRNPLSTAAEWSTFSSWRLAWERWQPGCI